MEWAKQIVKNQETVMWYEVTENMLINISENHHDPHTAHGAAEGCDYGMRCPWRGGKILTRHEYSPADVHRPQEDLSDCRLHLSSLPCFYIFSIE